MRRLALVATFLVATFIGGLALAESPLSARQVEAFVATLEDMSRTAGAGAASPAASARYWLLEAGASQEAQHVLGRHGFTETSWGETAYRVINAYLVLKDGGAGHSGAMDEEIQQAVQEIENDADLSESQRAEFIARLRASREDILKSRVGSEQDMAVVRPFAPRLDRLITPD